MKTTFIQPELAQSDETGECRKGEVGRREQLIRTGCRARLAEMLY